MGRSRMGNGWYLVPMQVTIDSGGRTARLEADEDGHLVARSHTVVTDDTMFALMDTGRRASQPDCAER